MLVTCVIYSYQGQGKPLGPSCRLRRTLALHDGSAHPRRSFRSGESATRRQDLPLQQGGKCRWCELLFQGGDIIEIDHITPRSQGGGEELSNKCALHRHCHDQRHARHVNGTHDKGQITEEPDDANVSRPVLKPSGGGDPFA